MIENKLIAKISSEISSEISSQKEILFIEAYKKKTGKDFNINHEKTSRFPSIKVCFDNGRELFYANDGSQDGLLIITFYPPEHEFSQEETDGTKSYKIISEIKYSV